MGRRSKPPETPQQRIERLLREAGHRSWPLPPVSRCCDGKTQYSEALAKRVAAELRVTTDPSIYAYPCVYCPAWHLGHPDYLSRHR